MEATKERPRGAKARTSERARLTMELDAALHRELKMEAAQRGISMREYITEILQRGHAEAAGSKK